MTVPTTALGISHLRQRLLLPPLVSLATGYWRPHPMPQRWLVVLLVRQAATATTCQSRWRMLALLLLPSLAHLGPCAAACQRWTTTMRTRRTGLVVAQPPRDALHRRGVSLLALAARQRCLLPFTTRRRQRTIIMMRRPKRAAARPNPLLWSQAVHEMVLSAILLRRAQPHTPLPGLQRCLVVG